jgi:hypothetical protein
LRGLAAEHVLDQADAGPVLDSRHQPLLTPLLKT